MIQGKDIDPLRRRTGGNGLAFRLFPVSSKAPSANAVLKARMVETCQETGPVATNTVTNCAVRRSLGFSNRETYTVPPGLVRSDQKWPSGRKPNASNWGMASAMLSATREGTCSE